MERITDRTCFFFFLKSPHGSSIHLFPPLNKTRKKTSVVGSPKPNSSLLPAKGSSLPRDRTRRGVGRPSVSWFLTPTFGCVGSLGGSETLGGSDVHESPIEDTHVAPTGPASSELSFLHPSHSSHFPLRDPDDQDPVLRCESHTPPEAEGRTGWGATGTGGTSQR